VIDRRHAGDPIAERVSDYNGGTTTFVPNDSCYIAREIMQRLIRHRSAAAARAARLWPQNTKAGFG
jgi:hypothetical protein